ncbi:hypothetical protein DFS34DRAFT_620969 [Phlyctochytrium arcticum]|nr:hypothetical protein DFS34DRAFT_620969 [Phlyctochytrium arcticum]
MQCPHGKPWGHCFVPDCLRRFDLETMSDPFSVSEPGPSSQSKTVKRTQRPSQPGGKSKRRRHRAPSPPPSASSQPQQRLLSLSPPMQEGEAIKGRRNQENPCDCRLLDATIQNMPVHYRSNQAQCLLHGMSVAERNQLKRKIKAIKTGKPLQTHKSSTANSESSQHQPRTPSPPPSVLNEEEKEEEESNSKSKFTVKLGLTNTVKSDAVRERIVDAVMR